MTDLVFYEHEVDFLISMLRLLKTVSKKKKKREMYDTTKSLLEKLESWKTASSSGTTPDYIS